MITVEQNPKLGYYKVGNTTHYSKVQALMDATTKNSFPTWIFNDDAFKKLNWTVEPQTSLKELYRLRALQLREKYDYIRLEASGGGDSTTALFSFINNGIHIDEVIFRRAETGCSGLDQDPYNTKCENTLSEWNYAAKPLLNWLKKVSPKTKITVHDYTDNLVHNNEDDTWVFKSKDYFQPGHVTKHSHTGLIEHQRLLESGKRVCVLYGIDKPKMCIKKGWWFLYFLDLQANHSNPDTQGYTNVTNEYFYWTPDLPEIVMKQAHLIKNWFSLPQNQHLQFLVRWPNHSISQRTAYEAMVKPIIYPDYDPATFQVVKPTNSFYNEMDFWFYRNFKETPQHKVWRAGLRLLVNSIDKKFFNYEQGKPVGFNGFLSPFYCLGRAAFNRITNVDLEPVFPNLDK